MSTAALGIGVSEHAVRAVLVRKGNIAWAAEIVRQHEDDTEQAVTALLDRAPLKRSRRLVARAAIGPRRSQFKLLRGLPETRSRDRLAAMVREASSSFFLTPGTAISTGVSTDQNGMPWASAIETATIEAIHSACRAHRLGLQSVLPAAAVLPAFTTTSLTWFDGDVALEIVRRDVGPPLVTRRYAETGESRELDVAVAKPLSKLGEGAGRFADAYGAAILDDDFLLGCSPLMEASSAGRLRRRLVVPMVVIVATAVWHLATPVLAARVASMNARALELLHANEAWEALETGFDQVDRVTAVLNEVVAFSDSRIEMTSLMGDLTEALPQGMAITEFEVIDTRGSLVVLTPSSAELLSAVRSVPFVVRAEIDGGTVRAVVEGRELQRVSIEFVLARHTDRNGAHAAP